MSSLRTWSRIVAILVASTLVIFLNACDGSSTTPTPKAGGEIKEYKVEEKTTEVKPIWTEEVNVNNCNLATPLTGRSEYERTVYQSTEWEFGGQTGIGGQISIPALGSLKVDAAVSAKYGTTEGSSKTRSEAINYDVPGKAWYVYMFDWNVTYGVGSILAGGKEIKYRYPREVGSSTITTDSTDCRGPETKIVSGLPAIAQAFPVPGQVVPLKPMVGALLTPIPAKPTPATASSSPVPVKSTATATSGVNDFVKRWINTDPKTQGITRINIEKQGNSLLIHSYGECSPTDCDWGTVNVPYQGSPISVSYRFSFKTTTLSLSLQGNRLYAKGLDQYTDSSGRTDRVFNYEFTAQ